MFMPGDTGEPCTPKHAGVWKKYGPVDIESKINLSAVAGWSDSRLKSKWLPWIANQLHNRNPVVAHIHTAAIPSHFVVITGIDYKAHDLIIADPATSNRTGFFSHHYAFVQLLKTTGWRP
jgi:hypothetical protein